MFNKSTLLIVALLVVASCAVKINVNTNVKPTKTIVHDTWIEEKNDLFAKSDVKNLMGFKRSANRPSFPVVSYPFTALPTSFDSTQQWPQCETIGAIQNQAECGSCWAFGAIEAISDRFCIHKNESVQLSFQDLVACDETDNGCEGGDAYTAWSYVRKHGVVSAACSPYTIPTCPPAQQPCLNFVPSPQCSTTCASNSSIIYKNDIHKVKTVYQLRDNVNTIQTEIMSNGPVEACFEVYEDFVGYKSGVYAHTTGKDLGGHCVKIIGWGVENGVNYWLVNNSWTTYWGDNGQFKIKMGVNECGIESDVVAGLP
eukprot:gene235-285_t